MFFQLRLVSQHPKRSLRHYSKDNRGDSWKQKSQHKGQQQRQTQQSSNLSFDVPSGNFQPIESSYSHLINRQLRDNEFKDFIRTIHEDYRLNYDKAAILIDRGAENLTDPHNASKDAPIASALPLRAENLLFQAAAPRANVAVAFIEPLISQSDLESKLFKLDPRSFVFPPRIEEHLQLETIYNIFPQLKNGVQYRFDTEDPFYDKRVDRLRFIYHTGKKYLAGLTPLPLLFGGEVTPFIRRAAKQIDTKEPLTYVFNKDNQIVSLSQYGIINTGYAVGKNAGVNENSRILTTIPQHLFAGLSLGLGMTVANSAMIILASQIFDAEQIARSLEYEHATVLVCLADHVKPLLEKTKDITLKELETLIIVADPSEQPSVELLNDAKTALDVKNVSVVYSLQEVGAIAQSTNSFKEGVLGSLLPGTSAGIFDSNGKMLKKDSTGRLGLKGYNVAAGLLGETSEKFKDGYYISDINVKLEKDSVVLAK